MPSFLRVHEGDEGDEGDLAQGIYDILSDAKVAACPTDFLSLCARFEASHGSLLQQHIYERQ